MKATLELFYYLIFDFWKNLYFLFPFNEVNKLIQNLRKNEESIISLWYQIWEYRRNIE